MGWYKDKRCTWRYCENGNHTHCFSSEGTGHSAGLSIIWFIFIFLSMPTGFGPLIFICLLISELSKKLDPTRPKGRGVPSGWCKWNG